MSLIPLLFGDSWDRPSRIVDQHFGLGLDNDDLFTPLTLPNTRWPMRHPEAYYRPWRTTSAQRDTGSTVIVDKDKFQVNLDVQQFAPKEITVKATGKNTITIEGKHEEKQDEHGYISRHFVRRYVLPEGHDISKVESRLSSDGVLSIVAPKVSGELEAHRDIPIQHTGQPSKPIEAQKKETEKTK